jgi:pimeloyl-ACP methyl ester carboxylesterase
MPDGEVRIHVRDDGPSDAPAVVFLHGVAGSSRTYDWLPPEITDRRRIVRVDLRGHGESSHAPGTYMIDSFSADVAGVLERTVQRPAVLVGHSLGGAIAWELAQGRPELVTAALLEDPPLYRGEPEEHKRNLVVRIFPLMRDRAAAWQRAGVDVAAAADEIAARPYGADPALRMRDRLLDDAITAMADAQLRMDPEVLTGAANGRTLAGMDTSAPVGVPVKILAADDAEGPAFTSAHERRLAETHPSVEVVRVAGAGHLIHDERRSRATYAEHLAEFLGRHA